MSSVSIPSGREKRAICLLGVLLSILRHSAGISSWENYWMCCTVKDRAADLTSTVKGPHRKSACNPLVCLPGLSPPHSALSSLVVREINRDLKSTVGSKSCDESRLHLSHTHTRRLTRQTEVAWTIGLDVAPINRGSGRRSSIDSSHTKGSVSHYGIIKKLCCNFATGHHGQTTEASMSKNKPWHRGQHGQKFFKTSFWIYWVPMRLKASK